MSGVRHRRLRFAIAAPRAPVAAPPTALPGISCRASIAGLAILLLWEVVVRAFAPAYVAKPTTVVLAIPRVIADPAFPARHRRHASAVAEGLVIALVLGTIIGLLMGRSDRRRARHPALRQRLLRHADDRRAAAVLAVVRLFGRHPHRHHHLRRHLLHHHQRRRRRALGAARISRSGALVPLRTRCACWARSCCRRRCPICWPVSGSPPAAR